MLRSSALICCLWFAAQGHATTVYKSVAADGVVSYSDTPPAQRRYETVAIAVPPVSTTPAEAEARLEEMQAATDKIAKARQAREQSRQQTRAAARVTVPATYRPARTAPVYYGYPYYRGRGLFRLPAPSHRPVDQIDPPPVRRRLPNVPVIPR